MDLQNLFYLTGIIFFIMVILILLGIGVVLFYIKKKITDIHQVIDVKIDQLYTTAAKPLKTAADISTSLLASVTSHKQRKKK